MLAGWFCVGKACYTLLFGLVNTPMTLYEALIVKECFVWKF